MFAIFLNTLHTNFVKKKPIAKSTKKHSFILWLGIGIFFVACIIAVLIYEISLSTIDTQCTQPHFVSYSPPATLQTASDWFMQGNYDYDKGNCGQAINDYTKAISLNSKYPEAYNNRAYTYMRMQHYQEALIDLDTAISLKPQYVQALMNRGDIHNYYYAIDRQSAAADYETVVSLGATQGTNVCGHLFLARHNGWNLGTILDLPHLLLSTCQ